MNKENTAEISAKAEISKTNTKPPLTPEEKKVRKDNWTGIIVNLVLAAISVYMFELWYDKVIELDTWRMIGNLSIIGILAATLFTAATSYKRGTMNKIKLGLTLATATAVILVLMVLVSPVEKDILYPISGILIVLIAFFMFYMSTGTMRTSGIYSMILGSAIILVWLKVYHEASWNLIGELAQASVFIILFFGGTWARLRMAWFGVYGVNQDSGFGEGGDGSGLDESED